MTSLDRKATELRHVVEDIVQQVRVVNAAAANGPHADLSAQELTMVEHLGDSGPRMMRELAEILLLAVNSVTSVVDNLERKGIVIRHRSDADRRVVRVELTDAGHAAYAAAVQEKLGFLRCMLEVLNEDEREIFMVLFRKIARAGRTRVEAMESSA
jgi:MarR family 2-MHQ and catechol resistance regulon transcriptional repressor